MDDQVLASVAGTLERVNKLVSVKPLRTKYVLPPYVCATREADLYLSGYYRYRGEVGDLVVGRIVEVRFISAPSATRHR